MKTNQFLYFAFGSCMNHDDIHRTVNDAERIGLAVLDNHELLFNIWAESREAGVANIAPKEGSRVFGSLWEVSAEDLIKLDIREAHPMIYERSIVQITSEQLGKISAITYIGKRFNDLGREHYQPSNHYSELLKEGLYESSNYDPSRTLVEEEEIEKYLQRIDELSSVVVDT